MAEADDSQAQAASGADSRTRLSLPEAVREQLERLSFLVQTWVWLVLDGLFMVAAFFWLRFIDAHVHINGLHGWEHILFEYCHGALDAFPLALVVVRTIIDFAGAVKRMVQRR